MLILLGEILKKKQEPVGQFNCPCCNGETEFNHVEEKYYFSIFFIPLLPLNVAADYWQCASCGETFAPKALNCPSYTEAMHNVLAYLLSGYGFSHLESAQQAFNKICGIEGRSVGIASQERILSLY